MDASFQFNEGDSFSPPPSRQSTPQSSNQPRNSSMQSKNTAGGAKRQVFSTSFKPYNLYDWEALLRTLPSRNRLAILSDYRLESERANLERETEAADRMEILCELGIDIEKQRNRQKMASAKLSSTKRGLRAKLKHELREKYA